MVRIALQYALAPSTQRSYSSIQTRYLVFCSSLHLSPIPVSQDVLCKFVVWLAAQGVSHSSIKGYLSAIHHLHITSLCQDPAIGCMAGLHYVLQGIKRIQSMSPATRPTVRLPVTAGVMRLLKRAWEQQGPSYNRSMLWAALCTCFFGFLRSSEATTQSLVHLSVSDVSLDSSRSLQ